MIAYTERLILRAFTFADSDDFKALIRDKMASENSIYDEQYPTDDGRLDSILSFFVESDEFFAVQLKQERRLIGFVSLNAVSASTRNLGYCIYSKHQGKGYASEAVTAIIAYARGQLRLKRLIFGTAERNIASVKILQNAGFRLLYKQPDSFVDDTSGNPVTFISCSYELAL